MAFDIPEYPEVPELLGILGLDPVTFQRAQEAGLNIRGILGEEDYEEAIETYFDPLVGYGERLDVQQQAANEGEGRRNLSPRAYQPGNQKVSLTARNRTSMYSPGDPITMTPAAFDEDSEYTEVPTATTNPTRPRTIAAAYERGSKKLTVMFLDRTLYNYYNVSLEEWNDFKASPSKGRYILDHLDAKTRGFADLTDMPEEVRLYAGNLARAAQLNEARKSGYVVQTINRRRPKTSKAPKPIQPKFGTGYKGIQI